MISFKYKDGDIFEARYYGYENKENFLDRDDGQEFWYFNNTKFLINKSPELSGTYEVIKLINYKLHQKHNHLIEDLI